MIPVSTFHCEEEEETSPATGKSWGFRVSSVNNTLTTTSHFQRERHHSARAYLSAVLKVSPSSHFQRERNHSARAYLSGVLKVST